MVNIQLLVRGNETKPIEVDNQLSIFDLKNTIASTFNVADVQQMNLYSNGQPMQDEKVLSEFNLGERSTIDVDFGLLGGKVHGSLARAGKVKGQTPKVAKKEDKKKPKTGRAKRRLQYNRRFVNVVVGPGGRRKGPNAGAGVAQPSS